MNIAKNFYEIKEQSKSPLNNADKNKVIDTFLSFTLNVIQNLISNLDSEKKTSMDVKTGYDSVKSLLMSGGVVKQDFSLENFSSMNKDEKNFAKEAQKVILNNIESTIEYENIIAVVKLNNNKKMAMMQLQLLLAKTFDDAIVDVLTSLKRH